MKVYFIGAGPGDPELLTRKAERLLRQAAVCIYAGSLVSPQVLELLPEKAEKHDSAGMSLEQILAVILQARSRNLDVVRLHTGDPAIYGAINEQMVELDRHRIEHEVVPGVSAFQAAAAALGWELTLPGRTQTIILTRTPGNTPVPPAEKLEHLAAIGATLCLFLSIQSLEETCRILKAHYGPECPAAVVYHASWPDEKIAIGTLADLAGQARAAGISKTAMILVRPFAESGNARSRLYDPGFSHGFRKGADPC